MTRDESVIIFGRFEIIVQPFPFEKFNAKSQREFIGISMEFVNSCEMCEYLSCHFYNFFLSFLFFNHRIKWVKEKIFWKHKYARILHTYVRTYVRYHRTIIKMHWIPLLSLIFTRFNGILMFWFSLLKLK